MLTAVSLVWIAGCSAESKNETKNEAVKILVEKRIGEGNQFGPFPAINDNREIQKVEHILDNAKWETAEVSMVSNAHYKFYFGNKLNDLIYALWISPSKDKVELVIQAEGKYVQLKKDHSERLFKIITGKKLSDE